MVIALISTEGGILLSLAESWPPSFCISTISFALYVAARIADPRMRVRLADDAVG